MRESLRKSQRFGSEIASVPHRWRGRTKEARHDIYRPFLHNTNTRKDVVANNASSSTLKAKAEWPYIYNKYITSNALQKICSHVRLTVTGLAVVEFSLRFVHYFTGRHLVLSSGGYVLLK